MSQKSRQPRRRNAKSRQPTPTARPRTKRVAATGPVQPLNNVAHFQQKVEAGDKPVLIDFWAPWCGPCRATAPAFEAAARAYGEQVGFYKVNTDEARALAQRFGIRSIPTMVAMHDGEVVDTHIGAATQAGIETMAQRLIRRAGKTSGDEAGGLLSKVKGLFG